jgi:type VI secretion system (T6SS) phospholipase Tle1-like effector
MPKRLIVCCDGTWNTADQAKAEHPCPTNVTKLALSITPEDSAGVRQCVYYHSGVGTSQLDRLRGGMFGFGLSRNVFDAYHFLIDNYEPGDVLYFFGFSRGAFTARSLAGLIRNCGILRPENADRINEAWTLYRSSADKPRGVASTLFRRSYSYDPRIHFIGVWDTVGAYGVPVLGPRWLKPIVKRLNHRWEFHDTKLSTRVDGAFHALAIDERRAAFEPTLWHQQPGADRQELKQVWFTGVHCDIGGGYADTSLSDIALLWMADRARLYGLEFLDGAFGHNGPAEMTPGESIDFKVEPHPMTHSHSSWTKFYRLVKPQDRPIGMAADEQGRLDGLEYLATTAKEHYDGEPLYRPTELVKYLARSEHVHLEPVLTKVMLPAKRGPRPAAGAACPAGAPV